MSDILYFEDSTKKSENIEDSIVNSVAEEVKNIEGTENEAKTAESAVPAEMEAAEPETETSEVCETEAGDAEECCEDGAESSPESCESADSEEAEEATEAADDEEAEETKKSFFEHVTAYGEKFRESAVKAGNAVKEQTARAGEQIKDAGKKVTQRGAETEAEETKNEIAETDGLGTIRIADEVVAMIAMYAAKEVEGVADMAESNTREWLGKVGIKDPLKGVRVEVNEKHVRVDLQITMGYGYNIPATSSKVQARVKQAIENMTGLDVTDINVRIAGITVSNDSSEN